MFSKFKKPKKIIYFDHAAATPLDNQVKAAMAPYLDQHYGNPSSLHRMGVIAKQAIEDARQTAARLINAGPEEIILTAGGTESVNLAILGLAKGRRKCHIITSEIEHHAVLNSVKALAKEGHKVTYVGVDKNGFIKLEDLKKAIRPDTGLVSIMYANNEIGAIEPVAEIGKWLKTQNAKRKTQKLLPMVFHTDACQAAGFLDLNVDRLGVDLMSVNGSKIYGPKQAGFLYVRRGINLKPIIYGGGQERGLRSGTENVPGIVGLAKALALVQVERLLENRRLIKLRDYFIAQVFKKIPGATLNGPAISDKEMNRLPNNINLTIKGVEGEALMLYLDAYGICVSTGSACSTGHTETSHVLLAIGKTQKMAQSSVRISLGRQNTKQEADYAIRTMVKVAKVLRKANK
jgi:cysteine desulfurase